MRQSLGPLAVLLMRRQAHPLGVESWLQALMVVALAFGPLAVPFTTEAQPAGRVYRIGLFHVGLDHVPPSLPPLRERLRALGYEEGKNLRVDWRNLPDEPAAHKAAGEFVRDRVDLIVAFENQTVRAAKAASSGIPIVMLHVTDPVADGFVRSLAHPGGNVTGFAGLADFPAKRLEFFTEILPRLRRVLLLIDPKDPVTSRQLAEVRQAGGTLGLHLVERQATEEADIRHVFASLRTQDVDGVFVVSPNLYLRFTSLIIVNSRLICATFSLPECAICWGTVSARVNPDRGGKESAISHGAKHDQVPEAAGTVQHADRRAGRL